MKFRVGIFQKVFFFLPRTPKLKGRGQGVYMRPMVSISSLVVFVLMTLSSPALGQQSEEYPSEKFGVATMTFGASGMVGTWSGFQPRPMLNAQLEIHADPNHSVVMGGSALLPWVTAAGLGHIGYRYTFTPKSNSGLFPFFETGFAAGRKITNCCTVKAAPRSLSGVGFRAVGGVKWQARNRFVFEVSAGLTTSLYTVEELHSGRVVSKGPGTLLPEINLRLGWRTKRRR